MKNKNNLKIQLGAAALGVIATTALVAGVTYAQVDKTDEGMGLKKGSRQGIQKQENRDMVRTAIENNDYEAWLAAHPADAPNLDLMTEANFNKMVEAHTLMETGDREGAREIMEEAGFGKKMGSHEGKRGGNEEAKLAIENNDYSAWLAAHPEDCPNTEKLTEANFNKMIEAHSLKETGDHEGAREIMEEIGFGKNRGDHGGERGGSREALAEDGEKVHGQKGGKMRGNFRK